MKRKIYDTLLKWKYERHGKSALLIEGARRVGKSYIVAEFARNDYKSHLIIDFSRANDAVKSLFSNYLDDLDSLFQNLEAYYRVKLIPRESLIVFDEVQLCPAARAAIKHLVADGRYDYIETGSLISIRNNVKGIMIPSEEHAVEMFPMDFEEFLWAVGEDNLMSLIEMNFHNRKPMGPLHRRAIELFRLYMVIGGMPQAVKAYVESHDFNQVDEIKNDIIRLYRNDIYKYAGSDQPRVTAIFDEIPGQLQNHERKFKLSSIKPGARMRDYREAIFWLSDAYVVNCCYNSTAPNIGLRLNEDRTSLKCYMADTGLLTSLSFDEHGIDSQELYRKLMFDKLEANIGMLAENVVAQMLRAAGHKLYFFAQNNAEAPNRMEIDFLISKKSITSRHNIIPIEVKSGERYTLSSLRKCIDKFGSYITSPTVIHDKDLAEKDGILYLPFYMTPYL